MINVLETEWWSLYLPAEWWAEQDGDGILVGDRDGVGCIEISTLLHEGGAFSDSELETMVKANQEGSSVATPIHLAGGSGYYVQFNDEDAAVREWYLGFGAVALFISYSCELENAGLDHAAVDEILGTLSVDMQVQDTASLKGAGDD